MHCQINVFTFLIHQCSPIHMLSSSDFNEVRLLFVCPHHHFSRLTWKGNIHRKAFKVTATVIAGVCVVRFIIQWHSLSVCAGFCFCTPSDSRPKTQKIKTEQNPSDVFRFCVCSFFYFLLVISASSWIFSLHFCCCCCCCCCRCCWLLPVSQRLTDCSSEEYV